MRASAAGGRRRAVRSTLASVGARERSWGGRKVAYILPKPTKLRRPGSFLRAHFSSCGRFTAACLGVLSPCQGGGDRAPSWFGALNTNETASARSQGGLTGREGEARRASGRATGLALVKGSLAPLAGFAALDADCVRSAFSAFAVFESEFHDDDTALVGGRFYPLVGQLGHAPYHVGVLSERVGCEEALCRGACRL